MRYLIKWDNGAYQSFLFGSDIISEDQRVYFKNRIIPPGQSIKVWFSKTNYQRDRIPPSLPLLRKGFKYYIELYLKCHPSNSVYAKIIFEDRFGDEIGFTILKEKKEMFVYPKEAYSYKIELFNAGCKELIFEYILLYDYEEVLEQEDMDWNPKTIHHIHNIDISSETLFVVFVEDDNTSFTEDEKMLFESWGQVLLVGDRYGINTFYILPEIENYLKRILDSLTYKNIYFIGYGPVGNFAASYYSREYPNSHAYITSEFYDTKRYQFFIDKANIGEYKAKDVVYRMSYGSNVTYYGKSNDSILSIFDKIYHPLFRLNNLIGKQNCEKN